MSMSIRPPIRRDLILVISMLVCIIVTLIGSTMIPLSEKGILHVIGYNILMVLGLLGLFMLIYIQALPQDVMRPQNDSNK